MGARSNFSWKWQCFLMFFVEHLLFSIGFARFSKIRSAGRQMPLWPMHFDTSSPPRLLNQQKHCKYKKSRGWKWMLAAPLGSGDASESQTHGRDSTQTMLITKDVATHLAACFKTRRWVHVLPRPMANGPCPRKPL